MTDAAKTDPRIEHLGQRFGDLVYAAAARQIGEGSGAEDVTQAVFLVSLRKAKAGALPEDRYMAAWLLKITHFAVKEAWRAQKMRRHHERQAATQRPEMPAPGPDLESILAALDQALLKLGTLDREVIARRYLQNQTVGNVAAAVGMAENTASQRIGRALEKLRKALQRQGIVAPAASLTGLLLAESAKAAPASFLTAATTASANAIAKRATTMMKLATLKTAALVTCSVLALLAAIGISLTSTAKTQSPTPAPSALGPPAASPPADAQNDPRKPFMDTPPSGENAVATTQATTQGEQQELALRMRKVGIAINQYAADDGGKWPESLGATLGEELSMVPPPGHGAGVSKVEPETSWYLSPKDQKKLVIPEHPTAKWVDDHTSFVYLGKDVLVTKIPDGAFGTTVLLHERLDGPNAAKKEITLVFADLHSEVMTRDHANEVIKKSKQRLAAARIPKGQEK